MRKIFFLLGICFVACNNNSTNKKVIVADTVEMHSIQDNSQMLVCSFDSLSPTNRYSIIIEKDTEDIISKVYIDILNKQNNLSQKISFIPARNPMFNYSCSSRSYVTGYNLTEEVVDGIYGDIVVVDLNFDGREDFAISKDIGYVEFYNYYLQSPNGLFLVDSFLSKNMIGFPEIDSINKTLTTVTPYGALKYRTEVFVIDSSSRTFRKISSEINNIN